jgi:hypothetical protein
VATVGGCVGGVASADVADLEREWRLLQEIDVVAREVLAATDAWDAYAAANGASGSLVDDLTWMPHGGQVYVAWAELTDLFEIGETPLERAHDVLRKAAIRWLQEPEKPDPVFLAERLGETHSSIDRAARGAPS